MSESMDLYDIVMKLVGPVRPLGEHNADQERLANMKTLTLLTDRLLGAISAQTHAADRPEASMKAIGEHAKRFLDDLRDA